MADNPIYQVSAITQPIAETIIKDDSPESVASTYWSILGIDIPISDIKDFDFDNILDFVVVEVVNQLRDNKEEIWDKLAIIEWKKVKNPETQKMEMVIKNRYPLINLLDSVRFKAYVKMCRAREGFTFGGLTETRQKIRRELTGSMVEQGYSQMQPTANPPQGKRWGII